MTLWNQDDAARATQGEATGAFSATGVSIDTRSLKPGDLFVALQGESMDGHAYVKAAGEKGAVAAVVSRKEEAGLPLLVVKDTRRALEALGMAARARLHGKAIGLTGSVGKTGTKEMLRLAFAAFGETYATKGNLNNHFGVPLTLANTPPSAAFGIYEMGMNHAGEIASLTRQVRPHVALITTVAPVHLEFFASEAAIADAKAEIAEGIEPQGALVLPLDNPHFALLRDKGVRHGASILSFSQGDAKADARLVSCEGTSSGLDVQAEILGRTLRYRLAAHGAQWALNSLAALLAVHAAGRDVAQAAAALEAFSEPDGRGRMARLPWKGGTLQLMDDSYNASPPSMRAAMATAARLHRDHAMKGRIHAALGDMRELGRDASRLHAELAQEAVARGIDVVHTAGRDMAALREALPREKRGLHAETSDALAEALPGLLAAGDTLLIKGSHSMKMERIAQAVQSYKDKAHAL